MAYQYSRKENVKRAVHFQKPEYRPLMYYGLDELDQSDIALIAVEKMFGGEDGRTNEWGFVWKENNSGFALGVVETYPLQDWDKLDSYVPLQVDSWDRFAEGRKYMEQYPDRYFIADLVLSGFTICWSLHGYEDLLVDLYMEPEKVERLVDIVCGAEEELIRACAAAGFDAIAFGDDLGTQTSLMISPEIYRKVFKPRLKRQCDLAHSLGMDVFFHCCGYIMDIIPDLIEAGVDIVNPGQPALNGVAELGKQFGGKVCFGCPTGYQTTGVSGTQEEIDQEVRDYVDYLSVDNAGMIGLVYSGLETLGATSDIQKWVLETWVKYCGRKD